MEGRSQVLTDVAVVGGGLSGALFVRDLLRRRPGTRVVVVHPAPLPDVPRDQLGESTTEVGAWYLEEVLGLAGHLQANHVRKLGLRFYLARPGGVPFDGRFEFGPLKPGSHHTLPFRGTDPPTWQLDRRSLDPHLWRENLQQATHLQGTAMLDGPNRLRVGDGVVQAAWIVDASRSGVLDGILEPLTPLEHRFVASWAWIEGRIDPDHFATSTGYTSRIVPDLRWHSTNHLVGDGYWVWLIPQPDGRTSVGIVQRPGSPLLDRPSAWMAWLDLHEPECAAQIRSLGVPSSVQSRPVTATRAETVIDARGHARTGDAAGFLDPLYSSAIDQMALVNQLILPVITASLDGRPHERQARYANVAHAQVAGHTEQLYGGYHELLADPTITLAKVLWDNAIYFSTVAPMLMSGALADDGFFHTHGSVTQRVSMLQGRVQELLRTWRAKTVVRPRSGCLDQFDVLVLARPLIRLRTRPIPLAQVLADGLADLEGFAVTLLRRAARDLELELPAGPLNPYALTLDPAGFSALTRGRTLREAPADWADFLDQAGLGG